MKKVLFGLTVLALAAFLLLGKGPVSCQRKPMNGPEYIEVFTNFVERIRRESAAYTAKDWERSLETYELYSGPLYERFGPELSAAEHLKVQENRLRFTLAYRQFRAKEFVDEAGGEIESITGQVTSGARDLKNHLLDALGNLFPQGGNKMNK
jgi:hypothetical protein